MNFVNHVTLDQHLTLFDRSLAAELAPADMHELALPGCKRLPSTIGQLLPQTHRAQLLKALDAQTWEPVGLDGIQANYHPGEPIGSWRLSSYSPRLAAWLHERLSGMDEHLHVEANDPLDHDGHLHWRRVGINPLMRFISYEAEGLLIPHYDAPWVQDERVKTLQSLVVYLDHTPGLAGGATRFVRDPQAHLPLDERDLSDWLRGTTEHEIAARVESSPGAALVFDHRLLHDSEPVAWGGGQLPIAAPRKMILRTDVLYEQVTA